ncbi:MAG: DNA-processing protein DprA, partial [Nitrospirota bacterium]
AEEEAARAQAAGAEIITFSDERYPPNLKETHDPPPYLYVKGRLIPGDRVSLAMVGSRMATPYGRQATRRMAGELAIRGITIVSGGARGIDTEAHKGALDTGGRTIVVLGCGIDVTYPSENRELFEKVAGTGAVVTEYPVGAPPKPFNFPSRNRIISGISLGVVVMEAADDSGSLITASYSLEQGREVYALPGSVSSPTSRGTNSLIKKGAKLVESSQDILLDLFPYLKGYLRELRLDDGQDGSENAVILPDFNLEPEEKALFEYISIEPVHVDVLSLKAGMPVPRALSLLLGMELKGAVKQLSGMRYIREN